MEKVMKTYEHIYYYTSKEEKDRAIEDIWKFLKKFPDAIVYDDIKNNLLRAWIMLRE